MGHEFMDYLTTHWYCFDYYLLLCRFSVNASWLVGRSKSNNNLMPLKYTTFHHFIYVAR
jgi:hypothetical protein